jgi:hypothetical protein
MSFSSMSEDMNIIAGLDDEPNDVGGLSASQLKAKFDLAGTKLKTFINSLVAALNASTSAANIGAVASDGSTATNVQSAIDAKTSKVTSATTGNIAVFDGAGNLCDGGQTIQ